MALTRRNIILALLILGITTLGMIALRSYLFSRMRRTLEDKAEALYKSGFSITYDSIAIDWFRNSLSIEKLQIKKTKTDSVCDLAETITVERVHINGFRLVPLLLKGKLSVTSVHLTRPFLRLREYSTWLIDSAAQQENEFSVRIDDLNATGIRIEWRDTLCNLLVNARVNASVSSLFLDFEAGSPVQVKVDKIRTEKGYVQLPHEFYTLTLHAGRYDQRLKTLDLDTLRIRPHFSKFKFARKKGIETDRVEGLVPFINLSGLTWEKKDSLIIRAPKMDVQFYLKLFRDKRMPFKKVAKPLPVQALQALPVGIMIDTLTVVKSFVQYEEYAAGSNQSGKVYFDNLEASLTNVTNTSYQGKTILNARADLMGHGDIQLRSVFPHKPGSENSIEGSLRNFEIPRINAMLEPRTNLKAESGDLKELYFNFTFNALRSEGFIELNYENLRMISFNEEGHKKNRKKKRNGEDKNELKTFIMNTFIIRTDMDEKVPDKKRRGEVHFYRDQYRSIFNYWTKSLLSGIKAAYNLDKIEEKQNKKEEKKKKRRERKNRKRKKD